jgi:hypothetical protein
MTRKTPREIEIEQTAQDAIDDIEEIAVDVIGSLLAPLFAENDRLESVGWYYDRNELYPSFYINGFKNHDKTRHRENLWIETQRDSQYYDAQSDASVNDVLQALTMCEEYALLRCYAGQQAMIVISRDGTHKIKRIW